MTDLLAFWTRIPTVRRRHLMTASLGCALSWSLAALVACTTPGASTPLYQQLGGVAGIDTVVGRTLDRVSTDPRSARSFDGVRMSTLKKSVSAYVCKLADGPCKYEGETMLRAHLAAGITGSEFDIMVSVMREELERAGVSEAAKNELLRRLAPTRRDIVRN